MCDDLDDRERLERVGLGDEIPATVPAAVARLIRERDTLLSACAGKRMNRSIFCGTRMSAFIALPSFVRAS